MMKRNYRISLLIIYYLVYSFIYIGWISHHSLSPTIFRYSKSYFAFLAVMSSGFLLPVFLSICLKRFGRKTVSHLILNFAILLFALYFVFSLHYYYTQEHLFDPFLQNPLTPIEDLRREGSGTFRIICLGDSATKNLALPSEKHYPDILHRTLKERYPAVDIEVADASATWYTTKHSLISYVTYYEDWNPDLIIIMHGINDLVRSFSPPGSAIGEYNDLWTHFYGPSMRGVKPPTFEKRLLEYLDTPVNAWYAGLRYKEVDYPAERYVSLPMFEKNLRKLVRYIRHNGSDVILVTQPSLYKEDMTEEELRTLYFGRTVANTRINFLQREFPSHKSFYQAMKLFNETTKRVAREEGAICADAADSVGKNLRNFHDDIHYTREGAKSLAKVIAETIIEKQVVRKVK